MGKIFVNGRLSWTLVTVIVFLAASAVVFDYVWRIVEAPFEVLAILAVLAVGLGVTVLLAIGRVLPPSKL